MKKVVVEVIVDLIDSFELNEDYCILGLFDKCVVLLVVCNVVKVVMEFGVVRIEVNL